RGRRRVAAPVRRGRGRRHPSPTRKNYSRQHRKHLAGSGPRLTQSSCGSIVASSKRCHNQGKAQTIRLCGTMLIGLHNLAAKHANLLTSLRIARDTGYAGVEIGAEKLQRYLAQGFAIDSLRPHLEATPPIGLSYVQDIERQEPREYEALLSECETICTLAEQLGCPMVQFLTGPLEPAGAYRGLGGGAWPEMCRLTANNLRALSAIGKAHGVRFYLEALTFTPLHRLDQQLELLAETACANVGLVLDFYHLWGSGTRPDEIARVNKELIFCVDFCDSADQF